MKVRIRLSTRNLSMLALALLMTAATSGVAGDEPTGSVEPSVLPTGPCNALAPLGGALGHGPCLDDLGHDNPASSVRLTSLFPHGLPMGLDGGTQPNLIFLTEDEPEDDGEDTEDAEAGEGVEDEEDDEIKRPATKELPLFPERTFSFTANEGTWISVDVSPDGSTVLFDFLGDIYTVPIGGGKASQITEGLQFDAMARYSPDGQKIVMMSDRSGSENIWEVELETLAAAKEIEDEDDRYDAIDDAYSQITKGSNHGYVSPEYLPGGDYVVASRSKSGFGLEQLWMFHVDGGDGIQLVKEPENLRTVGAAPTPDGQRIWYAQRNGLWQYNAMFPQYQLGYYDRETGERYTRTSRYGSAFRPTLSPDGKWLVYGTRHETDTGLVVRDLGTGDERWLAYPVQRDDQESVASRDVLPGMSFTPDSKELVATYGGKIWRVPVDGSAAIEVPFEVDVELPVGPEVEFDYPVSDSAEFTARQIRDAVPSPDGTQIAFTVLNRLYVMAYPDGTPRALTGDENVAAMPVWSPDGGSIAYVTWSDDEGGHIYRLDTGSGGPRRLTTMSGIYTSPAWSPDGEQIVAIRGPARVYHEATGPFASGAADDIVWIPAEGGDATLIAPTDGRDNPHFSGGPERIYLDHREKGLISIRWDGSDEKEHVKVTGATLPGAKEPMRAGWIRKAPTGDRALAQLGADLFVLTVPMVGGETPTVSLAGSASVPTRKLTDIGGQFPAWGSDGKVHWSIGNAHFVYDLDEAERVDEEIAAEKKRKEREERKKKKKEEEEKKAKEDAEESEGESDKEGEPDEEDAEASEEADGEGDDESAEEDEEDEEDKKYKPAEHRIEVAVTRDMPQGTVVLRGARIVTMSGDEVIENGDVVIENHRIQAVGSSGEVSIPAGAETVDLAGKTIVPGFVDTHAHMWPTWGVHKKQSWMYAINLAYGVTTSRDPQTATTDVLTYADQVRAGNMIGPRVYSTGPGVFWFEMWRDFDHVKDALKRYSEYYDTKTIKMYLAGNRQQRQWIIMAAKEQGLMPTTEGALDFMLNMTMLQDGYAGQEHNFPIYPVYRDTVELAAFTKMTYTPTLLVTYGGPWAENYFYTRENPHDDPKMRRFMPHSEMDRRTRRQGLGQGPGPGGWFREEEYPFPKLAVAVKDIVEAGGRAGVGSHGQLDGLGYHWELWAMASGGISNHDALRTATILGAEAIGLDKDLGSIEAGKLADLVVLNGDPLDDLRSTADVHMVMINGRLYDADSLDQVYPDQVPFPEKYWVESEPATAAGVR